MLQFCDHGSHADRVATRVLTRTSKKSVTTPFLCTTLNEKKRDVLAAVQAREVQGSLFSSINSRIDVSALVQECLYCRDAARRSGEVK